MRCVSAVDIIIVTICPMEFSSRITISKAAGGVKEAITLAKHYAPFVRKIEVEVETLDMVQEALEAGADIIMLDNMTLEQMQQAVQLVAGRAQTECSGNVTKENIAAFSRSRCRLHF